MKAFFILSHLLHATIRRIRNCNNIRSQKFTFSLIFNPF